MKTQDLVYTLIMFSVRVPGPLDEKWTTTGAGLNWSTPFDRRMVAFGFLFHIKSQLLVPIIHVLRYATLYMFF